MTVLTFDDDFDGTSGSGLGGLKGLHRFLQLEPKTFYNTCTRRIK
jgi:hypothetical protein